MFKYYYITPDNFSNLIIISDGVYLTSVRFETFENEYKLLNYKEDSSLKIFNETKQYLNAYFKQKMPPYTPIYKLNNLTPFQKEVLKIVINIPYGTTLTYKDISTQIAINRKINKMSSQAVGSAIGKNPLCILIPCHRVIGKDNIGGYHYGIKNKISLLELENVNINKNKE